MIGLDEFLTLPDEEVARLVYQAGSPVCVFPINGTRRWYLLEHGNDAGKSTFEEYIRITGQKHIEVYRLFFDHGINTLLTPIFGKDILERSGEYMAHVGGKGMAHLATHSDFLNFYAEYDVRVRFYGDHRKVLAGTSYAYLSEIFETLSRQTAAHRRNRLFFGIFADRPFDTIVELATEYYRQHGKKADLKTMVEEYYGEYVEPVDLFIGFDKLSVFDYPLLASGEEDLYFTVAPSLYITRSMLRRILYDHLFSRKTPEVDYTKLSREEVQFMRDFYRQHRESLIGVGSVREKIWYPLLASPFSQGKNND
jgi:tuberculosinol/isotuberculosinol synthase